MQQRSRQQAAARRRRLVRAPFLILAILSLAAGVWGGLTRLPLNLPQPVDHANWITFHGPLMVCGFLGTVISLERAVGLGSWWTHLPPLLTVSGAFVVAGGGLGSTGPLLFTLASAGFLIVTFRVVQLQRSAFTIIMSLGAAAWLAGNGLWLSGRLFTEIAPWWIAFLALTILGERLDLSRFQKQRPGARPWLWACTALFLSGVGLGLAGGKLGGILMGAGLFALGLWLAWFDIARRTVRETGLPKFMAVCLLIGFAWLTLSGGLWIAFVLTPLAGAYDAALHAFFLGFVFMMIFGHAPVIFPAVLELPLRFREAFYGHVLLLNGSLLLRVAGDLSDWAAGRAWGGMLNGVAIALFLGMTVSSLVPRRKAQPGGAP